MSTSRKGPDAFHWYFQPTFYGAISIYFCAIWDGRPCTCIKNIFEAQKWINNLIQLDFGQLEHSNSVKIYGGAIQQKNLRVLKNWDNLYHWYLVLTFLMSVTLQNLSLKIHGHLQSMITGTKLCLGAIHQLHKAIFIICEPPFVPPR